MCILLVIYTISHAKVLADKLAQYIPCARYVFGASEKETNSVNPKYHLTSNFNKC